MHRKLALVLILMTAVSFSACKDDSGSNKFEGRTWSSSLSEYDSALERAILFDIMGGIVAGIIVPEEMSLSGLPDISELTESSKLSISVPLENSYSTTVDSFSFTSPSGSGTLEIDVNGDFQEVDAASGDHNKIRLFPIEVVFTFNEYNYTNSCGLPAVISGTLYCRFQGTADRETDLISGTGNCSTGSAGMSGTILYKLSEEETHDVFIQTSMRAEGPWNELTSYAFYGNYMLDRRSGTVDSVITQPAEVCTSEE